MSASKQLNPNAKEFVPDMTDVRTWNKDRTKDIIQAFPKAIMHVARPAANKAPVEVKSPRVQDDEHLSNGWGWGWDEEVFGPIEDVSDEEEVEAKNVQRKPRRHQVQTPASPPSLCLPVTEGIVENVTTADDLSGEMNNVMRQLEPEIPEKKHPKYAEVMAKKRLSMILENKQEEDTYRSLEKERWKMVEFNAWHRQMKEDIERQTVRVFPQPAPITMNWFNFDITGKCKHAQKIREMDSDDYKKAMATLQDIAADAAILLNARGICKAVYLLPGTSCHIIPDNIDFVGQLTQLNLGISSLDNVRTDMKILTKAWMDDVAEREDAPSLDSCYEMYANKVEKHSGIIKVWNNIVGFALALKKDPNMVNKAIRVAQAGGPPTPTSRDRFKNAGRAPTQLLGMLGTDLRRTTVGTGRREANDAACREKSNQIMAELVNISSLAAAAILNEKHREGGEKSIVMRMAADPTETIPIPQPRQMSPSIAIPKRLNVFHTEINASQICYNGISCRGYGAAELPCHKFHYHQKGECEYVQCVVPGCKLPASEHWFTNPDAIVIHRPAITAECEHDICMRCVRYECPKKHSNVEKNIIISLVRFVYNRYKVTDWSPWLNAKMYETIAGWELEFQNLGKSHMKVFGSVAKQLGDYAIRKRGLARQ